ncbi:diacylglycerol kinase [Rhodoferax sp.]|uniref:diacylglycerol kinase n=1 Tax=Rhodoferax sp. TaxID=50421 RepID=UPI0025F376BE|nr:diacylglycerol kinase [Rhodoferax sp.]
MQPQPGWKLSPLQKHIKQTGLKRLILAFGYSSQGLKAGWLEPAFRQEALAAIVLLPLAFWLGDTWLELAVLVGAMVAVMVVELLNTAIEAAIDRVGPEWHDLSKKAKDLGSAAVLMSLAYCGLVWLAALWHKFLAV